MMSFIGIGRVIHTHQDYSVSEIRPSHGYQRCRSRAHPHPSGRKCNRCRFSLVWRHPLYLEPSLSPPQSTSSQCNYLTSCSIRTETKDSPSYLTSGFYRIQPGPTRNIPTYDYEETKYVLNGQIDVLDEATGVTHHLVAGDFAFFHVGSKAQFSSKSGGTAFFAVTRPIITQHPGLKGREEKVQSKL